MYSKNFINIIVSCLIVFSAFGQDPIDVEFANTLRRLQFNNVNTGDYEGTPYIQDDYLPAKISYNGRIYSVKYNAFEDRMELLSKGVVKALPLIQDYKVEFVNEGKVYKVFAKEKEQKGYFVVLFEGQKATLLAKELVTFQEAVKPQSGYDQYKPAMFKREKDRYYVGYKNGTTSILSNKKKDFYAIFGKYSEEIKKYVKSEKLNIKNSNDLIRIFQYFDAL